ncbi:MAG: sigma-70 family RNA polymerase sigma factor [Planctomycetes bacterium]|nr:sigma-70 family RNA polymerase sigma factor [Planctomycetota bacterium]
MPDAQEVLLLRRCQGGDQTAFRDLVERYQRRTYWIAHNLLNSYELAQDVSQEAFLRVYRHLGDFDLAKNFYTWLYQIVVNLSIDRLRKLARDRAVDLENLGGAADEGRGPSERGETSELRTLVHRTLDRLPPKYKAVLVLRDIQGLSCEEIAEIAGCTNATVRWRLHRARRLFKTLWEGRALGVGGDQAEAV